MSDTPPGTPTEDAPVQPFSRGRIQWSRPPQAVFRVGPLPAGPARSRFVSSEAPRPARAGILSGSMIPPSRPTAPPLTSAPAPASVPEPEVTIDAVFVEIAAAIPEVTPEPEPAVEAGAAPEPEPAPKPRVGRSTRSAEVIVEAEEPDLAVTLPPLSGEAAAAAADPRAMPSVVVTPTLHATVSAAVETVTKSSRWLLIAAAIVVVVTGVFIWMATLPTGTGGSAAPLDPDAPPPAAPGLVEAASVATAPAPVETTTAPPLRPALTADPVPARSTPRVTRPGVSAPAPAITPEPITPRPYVEIAPLEQPAPTPAAPPPSDPSAPMQTQPQPLN